MQAFYADSISPHLSKTPEGYLIARSCPVARTGKQVYRRAEVGMDGEGLIEVNRTPEEVFSAATIASFEGKPIVSPHPPTFITAENISGYQKGHAQHIRKGPLLPNGEQALIADLVITDAALISRVEANSIRELSAGYDYRLEEDGADGLRMVAIRGNHIAVVPSGRAGSHVRILDANLPEEEGMLDVKGVKEFFAEAREMFLGLGWKPPGINDAESDAVKRNEEIAKESLKLDERTTDAKTKDEKEASVAKEEEEKKAAKDAEEEKEMKDKKARDAEEKEEKEAKEERKATDAKLSRIADALEKLVENKEKKEGEDEDYEDKEEKEGEDADLICTETLPPNERPKNPIPGADAAVEVLRRLAPVIAQTGDKKAIDAVNTEYRKLRGGKANDKGSSYAAILDRGERARDKAREQATDGADVRKGTDAADVSNAFVKNAAKFLGRNPKDVKLDDGGKQ